MNLTVAWHLALPILWTFEFSYVTKERPTKTTENFTTIALFEPSPISYSEFN